MSDDSCPRCIELRIALEHTRAIIRRESGFMWPEDQATMRAVDALLAQHSAPACQWDDETPVPTGAEP